MVRLCRLGGIAATGGAAWNSSGCHRNYSSQGSVRKLMVIEKEPGPGRHGRQPQQQHMWRMTLRDTVLAKAEIRSAILLMDPLLPGRAEIIWS